MNHGNNFFAQTTNEDLAEVYVGRRAYPVFADTDDDGIEELYVSNGLGWIYKYNVLRDDDSDGFWVDTDCLDSDASVNPNGIEICGDGIDQDCDGSTTIINVSAGECLAGEATGDFAGVAVSGAGDVDSDGFGDFLALAVLFV